MKREQVHHVGHGRARNSSRAGMMGGSSASSTRAAATRSMATANQDAAQSLAAIDGPPPPRGVGAVRLRGPWAYLPRSLRKGPQAFGVVVRTPSEVRSDACWPAAALMDLWCRM